MNDWQRSFLGKLESAKKHWQQRFEDSANEHLEPVFERFAEFTRGNGFSVSAPDCEPGTRLFKFGLTENGYVLLTFRMRGLDGVSFTAEYFVPGPQNVESTQAETQVADAPDTWFQKLFERSLDRFVVAFGEASEELEACLA